MQLSQKGFGGYGQKTGARWHRKKGKMKDKRPQGGAELLRQRINALKGTMFGKYHDIEGQGIKKKAPPPHGFHNPPCDACF